MMMASTVEQLEELVSDLNSVAVSSLGRDCCYKSKYNNH